MFEITSFGDASGAIQSGGCRCSCGCSCTCPGDRNSVSDAASLAASASNPMAGASSDVEPTM